MSSVCAASLALNLSFLSVFLGGSHFTSNAPAVKDFITTAACELSNMTHALLTCDPPRSPSELPHHTLYPPHPYIPASFSSLCFRLSPVFCSFHEQMERMSTVFCRKQLFLTSQLSHYILRILLVQWSRVRFYCPTINILQLNFFLVIDSRSGDGTQTSHTMMVVGLLLDSDFSLSLKLFN